MPTQVEIDKENDWQLAEWNRSAIEDTITTPAPIPPAMLTAATEAIKRQQYTSPLVSRNLADAALAAAGYGELVAVLEEMAAAMRAYQMDVDEYPPFKHRMMMHKTRELLARVHGEAGEGKR